MKKNLTLMLTLLACACLTACETCQNHPGICKAAAAAAAASVAISAQHGNDAQATSTNGALSCPSADPTSATIHPC